MVPQIDGKYKPNVVDVCAGIRRQGIGDSATNALAWGH
jgi:hypothetical protein